MAHLLLDEKKKLFEYFLVPFIYSGRKVYKKLDYQ